MHSKQPPPKKPAFVDDEVARELAERMGLDPKGRSDDPFKAAIEKVVPLRVTSEFTPEGPQANTCTQHS